MYDMKELRIKLCYISDFFFTVRVNGEEKEITKDTNIVTFQVPEDADYEVEITQKQPPGNHRIARILLSPFYFLYFLIFVVLCQEVFADEWIGDIQPFLLKTKIKGNMRRHSELNLYYYKSCIIKDEYTKPQLVCDEIAPYETTYEVNKRNIKKTFHRFAAIMTASVLVLMAIFVPVLIFGLIGPPIEIVNVIVSSVLIAGTIVIYAIVLSIKRRKWYKYLHTN